MQLVAAPRLPTDRPVRARARDDRLARGRPGDLFVGLSGRNVDGGRFAAAGARGRRVGVLVAPDHAHHDRFTKAGVILADRRPARRAAGAGARVAPRAECAVIGDHRLHRQDVDEGHPRGDALPARPRRRQRGQLQHRDRPAAVDPRGARRHRGARARDGDARHRPDRRAGGDRRARRRRHRQRRPGPSRAARFAGGDRGGEGRAARRSAAGATAILPADEPLLDAHRRDDLDP